MLAVIQAIVWKRKNIFANFAQRVVVEPLDQRVQPAVVLEAMDGYYRQSNANVHRAVHTLAGEATDAYEDCREALREWFNAERVVLTSGIDPKPRAMKAEPIPSELQTPSREEEQAEVIRRLEEDIIFGRFAPGLRLVEDTLMQRYGASRHFVESEPTVMQMHCDTTRLRREGPLLRITLQRPEVLNAIDGTMLAEIRDALAEDLGVPMHTAAAAMQIFHAGKTRYPDGDNWICTRVIEEIIGAELHRDAAK